MIVRYHIFTDNKDDWTSDWKEAVQTYLKFKQENDCARLYKEVYPDQEAYENDEGEENCIYAFGPYPL